jgi:hypothetical protein
MIPEANKTHYRGVSCFRCRTPIAVSVKILGLQDEVSYREKNVVFSFPLRCRACEEESVYAANDIQRFEGEPETRRSRQYPLRSKAAKA